MKKILKYIRKYIVLGSLLLMILIYTAFPVSAYTEFFPGDYVPTPLGGVYVYSNQALLPIQVSWQDSNGRYTFENGYSSNGSFYFDIDGVVHTRYDNAIANYYVNQEGSSPVGMVSTYMWDRGFLSQRHELEYKPILLAGNSYSSEGYNFLALERYVIDSTGVSVSVPSTVTIQNPGVLYLHTNLFSDVSSYNNVDFLGGFYFDTLRIPDIAASEFIDVVYSFDISRPGRGDVHVRSSEQIRYGSGNVSTDEKTLYNSYYAGYVFPALYHDWVDTYLVDHLTGDPYEGPFTIQNLSVQYLDITDQATLSNYNTNVLQNYAFFTDPFIDRSSDITEGEGKFYNSNVYEDLYLMMSIDDDGSFADGYNSGYNAGESYGYENGFNTGSAEGYLQGVNDSLDSPDVQALVNSSYNKGFDTGYYNGLNNNLDFTRWIANAVGGFLDFELFRGVTIAGMLGVILAFFFVMWFLKLFAGG